MEVEMKSNSIRAMIARTLWVSSIAALCTATEANAQAAAQQSVGAESSLPQVTSRAFAAHPEYILTPKGVFAHKTCVHSLEKGDQVDHAGNIRKNDGTVQVVSACAYPEIPGHMQMQTQSQGVQPATDNGWTEYAYWFAPSAVGVFQNDFHVPEAPGNFDGQLIYIFPGMQGGGAIIQTVIQYGNNGGWGGQYWTLNTWAGGGGEYNGNYYSGNVISVSTGDVIFSDLYGDPGNCNANGCLWEIVGLDTTNGQESSYGTYINISWNQVIPLAIEVYGVDTCADYPATYDNSYNFYVAGWNNGPQWAPSWTSSIFVETCNESVSWDSGNDVVNLFY
jgi:hypothetical protein